MEALEIAADGVMLCRCVRRADILGALPRIPHVAILVLVVALHLPGARNNYAVPVVRVVKRLSKIRRTVSVVLIKLETPLSVEQLAAGGGVAVRLCRLVKIVIRHKRRVLRQLAYCNNFGV